MWPQLAKNCVYPFGPLCVWTQNPRWQMPFRRQPWRRRRRRRRHSPHSALAPDVDDVRGSEEEKQPAQVQLEESEGVKAEPKGCALRRPHQHAVGEEPRHFTDFRFVAGLLESGVWTGGGWFSGCLAWAKSSTLWAWAVRCFVLLDVTWYVPALAI